MPRKEENCDLKLQALMHKRFLAFLASNFKTREGLKVNQHFDKFVVSQIVFKHAQQNVSQQFS